jgi:hypothetical protein
MAAMVENAVEELCETTEILGRSRIPYSDIPAVEWPFIS